MVHRRRRHYYQVRRTPDEVINPDDSSSESTWEYSTDDVESKTESVVISIEPKHHHSPRHHRRDHHREHHRHDHEQRDHHHDEAEKAVPVEAPPLLVGPWSDWVPHETMHHLLFQCRVWSNGMVEYKFHDKVTNRYSQSTSVAFSAGPVEQMQPQQGPAWSSTNDNSWQTNREAQHMSQQMPDDQASIIVGEEGHRDEPIRQPVPVRPTPQAVIFNLSDDSKADDGHDRGRQEKRDKHSKHSKRSKHSKQRKSKREERGSSSKPTKFERKRSNSRSGNYKGRHEKQGDHKDKKKHKAARRTEKWLETVPDRIPERHVSFA